MHFLLLWPVQGFSGWSALVDATEYIKLYVKNGG